MITSKEEYDDWSHGILTEQDLDFLTVMNEVTDILTMHGADPEVQNRMLDINEYMQKYAIPEGFKERMQKWNEEESK